MCVSASPLRRDKYTWAVAFQTIPGSRLSYISFKCLQVSASSTVCFSYQIICYLHKLGSGKQTRCLTQHQICILMSHCVSQCSGNLTPGIYGTWIHICICQTVSAGGRHTARLYNVLLRFPPPKIPNPKTAPNVTAVTAWLSISLTEGP